MSALPDLRCRLVVAFARLVDLVGALARPLAAGAGAVPLTCAGRPWRRLQVGSDGALLGCYGRRVVGDAMTLAAVWSGIITYKCIYS